MRRTTAWRQASVPAAETLAADPPLLDALRQIGIELGRTIERQRAREQMQRQQSGLRNKGLDHLTLVKEEVVVAKFHDTVDRWMAGKGAR